MTRPRRPRPPTGSTRAGAAAVTVTTVGVLPVYMVGVLWVQLQEDLGFGPQLLGTLVASFFLTSAVSALTAGAIVGRFGTSPIVRLSALVGAASMLVIALAAQHTAVLVAALVFAGWGNGIGQPASNDLIARAVAPSRHGLAYGTKQAAIPLSTMIAGVAVPALAIPLGWRTAFAVGAALALLVVLTVPGAGQLRAPGSEERSEAAGPFRRGPLLVLSLGLMLGAATGNALGSFFVATAVEGGIAPATAGVLAAVASGLGAAARIGFGWLADRFRTRWLLVVAAQMAIGGLSYALLGTGIELLIAVGALIGYCTGWAWAGLTNFSVARMHPGMAARATSITQVGTGAGAALGPLLFGIVVSATSYSVAWYATAALSAAGGAVVVQGRRMLMRTRPQLAAARRQRRKARHT
ncbi:MFS transporter [Blastococcus haudaquaticus]|uniref:Predicted arabinose efflux permease, MFS family n=1 Tax=Blastococcus haudaquaticus TaxID=1938745 RepID=A0A286GUZ8_9ACTN|nr:MFS transporter [Blastococcus haudaquaticus]SOD99006.1 Predicted arabinose efflux permease, MFS family [Blastococcus haudaquaticus]